MLAVLLLCVFMLDQDSVNSQVPALQAHFSSIKVWMERGNQLLVENGSQMLYFRSRLSELHRIVGEVPISLHVWLILLVGTKP